MMDKEKNIFNRFLLLCCKVVKETGKSNSQHRSNIKNISYKKFYSKIPVHNDKRYRFYIYLEPLSLGSKKEYNSNIVDLEMLWIRREELSDYHHIHYYNDNYITSLPPPPLSSLSRNGGYVFINGIITKFQYYLIQHYLRSGYVVSSIQKFQVFRVVDDYYPWICLENNDVDTIKLQRYFDNMFLTCM